MKKIISIFLLFISVCFVGWSVDANIAYGASVTPTPTMYSAILNAIQKEKSSVDLSSYLRKGQKFSWKVLDDIENNEPSIFYLDDKKVVFWSNGRLELKYKYSVSTILLMQKQMDSNANAIIKKVIYKGMNDYQKVMALHDYMADYLTYDIVNYKRNTVPANSYTAYGALVKKVAVCDGYTQAMNYLFKKAGIESHRVTGLGYQQDGSSGSHAWNLVKVSGAYFYMDLTWDDNDIKDRPDTSYKYFLVTQQELSRDHAWSTNGLPKAISTKYQGLHHASDEVFKTTYGIFFSDDLDNDRLYFVKLDGTGKKRLTTDRAIHPVVSGPWVYFSNYSNGGYLYKVKTNGEQLTKLNNAYTIPVMLKDGNLIVKDGDTNKEYVFK